MVKTNHQSVSKKVSCFSRAHPISQSQVRGLATELAHLVEGASDEQFEMGMVSKFARGLQKLCVRSPISVLTLLKKRIQQGKDDVEITSEIMRWTGRQNAEPIRYYVILVLLVGLRHHAPKVRDSAFIGLSELEGQNALDHLKQAIAREIDPELREDMQDLVSSL